MAIIRKKFIIASLVLFLIPSVATTGTFSQDMEYIIGKQLNCLPVIQTEVLKRPDIFIRLFINDGFSDFKPSSERQKYFKTLATSGDSKIETGDKDLIIRLLDGKFCTLDLRKISDPNLQQYIYKNLEDRRRLIIKVAADKAKYSDIQILLKQENIAGKEMMDYWIAVDKSEAESFFEKVYSQNMPKLNKIAKDITSVFQTEFDMEF